MFYQSALGDKGRATALRDVPITSERILKVMDNLTNLHNAALKQLLGSMAYPAVRCAAL